MEEIIVDPRYKTWEEETERYPPHVREVARRFPAYRCYRTSENPAYHYRIGTYSHDPQTGEVRVMLIHGSGDPLAGIATYGQPWQQLRPCDCGSWEAPTPEEISATKARLAREHHIHGDSCGCNSPWKPPRPGAA